MKTDSNEKRTVKVSGFEHSLNGEQGWPPKMVKIKRLVRLHWENEKDELKSATVERELHETQPS